MDFFVSFRRQWLAPWRRHWPCSLKSSFSALAAGLLLATVASAQVSKTSMPDAPIPNSPALKASLTNSSASLIGDADSLSAADPLPAGDVSLYTVVDLALRNSKSVLVAEAEQQRARGTLSETRDVYIPNLSIGGGPGYSYGFPIGGPYLFNVTSTSLLFSFSQHDYIHSTRAALQAASLSLQNARQQVILEAAQDYIGLDKTLEQIAALNEAIADTDKLITVVEDRMQAGLESKVSVTRAQLTRAQIRLREIQMEDHAEELRKHLAGLTGLPADSIAPLEASIPPLPDLDFHSLIRDGEKSPVVQAAFATAESRRFSAIGDKKQNNRPTVNMAFQYQRFATFNGYQSYYLRFQQNNIGVGIQALWPVFDPVRRDKTIESRAEADRAQRQAELTRIQNDESNFALWHSLRELEAQEQVAVLQQQLAQDTLASTVTQMNEGTVAANGAAVTPQQAEQSRIEERTSYVDMQDAQFNVTRVKLDLMNAVGELEDWAKQSDRRTH